MRLQTRYFVMHLAAVIAWILVCIVALMLWIGISTHARAESVRILASQNTAQSSRGPAAFPVDSTERANAAVVQSGASVCSDYKRQIEQLQKVIALQNQKIALLGKK